MAETKYPLSLVIRAVDGVTKPLEAINSKLEKSFAPFAKLGNSFGALGKAMGGPALADSFGKARDAAGNLGDKVLGLGKMFAGLALGSAGLLTIGKGALDAGDRLGELAQRVGLGVDTYASLEHAAAQADVGNEAFAASMDRFNKGLGEMRAGTGPFISFLGKVGPGLLKQVKASKSTEEALSLITDAMTKIEDPARRAALASALFGKSGAQMGQFLGQGSAEIQKQQVRFMELAGSQEELVKNSGALDNALRESQIAFLGLRNVAAGALMPAITRLTEIVTGFVVKNRDGIQQWAERTGAAIQKWIDGGGVDRLVTGLVELKNTVVTVVDKVGGLGNALGLVAAAMAGPTVVAAGQLAVSLVGLSKEVVLLAVRISGVLLSALGKLAVGILEFNFGPLLAGLRAATASVWSFTAALLANPITWVVIAVAALAGVVYLVYRNWDSIVAFFWERWDAVKKVFSGFLSWVGEHLSWTPLGMLVNNWEPVKAFFVGLWDSITAIFKGAWETISPIVDKVMSVAQFIPGFGGGVAVVNGARSLFGGEGAAPALGAAGALPPARASETKVQVDFANVPRGVRVTPTQQAPEFELNLGLAMAPGT